jgi:hypothetical protein
MVSANSVARLRSACSLVLRCRILCCGTTLVVPACDCVSWCEVNRRLVLITIPVLMQVLDIVTAFFSCQAPAVLVSFDCWWAIQECLSTRNFAGLLAGKRRGCAPLAPQAKRILKVRSSVLCPCAWSAGPLSPANSCGPLHTRPRSFAGHVR